MRSICFLLSRISSRTSIILVRVSRISCFTSLRLAPRRASSCRERPPPARPPSSACLRIFSICLQICSMRLSSLSLSCAAAPSRLAGLGLDLGLALGLGRLLRASFTTSRTRSLPALQLVADVEDLRHRQPAGEQRAQDFLLALLDALGDLHLALAGEERDRAHLAQVQAHRVVGLAARLVVLVLLLLLLGLLGLPAPPRRPRWAWSRCPAPPSARRRSRCRCRRTSTSRRRSGRTRRCPPASASLTSS